jgi:hypothetical protein
MLLSGDGTLKIADFGLAIDLNQERAVTRAGVHMQPASAPAGRAVSILADQLLATSCLPM